MSHAVRVARLSRTELTPAASRCTAGCEAHNRKLLAHWQLLDGAVRVQWYIQEDRRSSMLLLGAT